MRVINRLLLSVLTLAVLFSQPSLAEEPFITLASTTSTQASGFFDYFLPLFKQKTGIEVRVVAVGTGQALKLGEKGDADVLLVHDKAGELKFVEQGFGVGRREVMYNDFVIVGPKADPAGVKGKKDAVLDFKKIAEAKAPFASRGDDSGTHRMELRLWKEAGIDLKASGAGWYKELGAGMGAVLNTAAGMNAYTLSDRATWVTFKNRADLDLLDEGDTRLFNQYSVILVNPAKHKHVKKAAALRFMDWMTSPEGQEAIGNFKVEGQSLFNPNAKLFQKAADLPLKDWMPAQT
jgi:tungstate transport system substrate-binding protein